MDIKIPRLSPNQKVKIMLWTVVFSATGASKYNTWARRMEKAAKKFSQSTQVREAFWLNDRGLYEKIYVRYDPIMRIGARGTEFPALQIADALGLKLPD